MSNRGQKIIMFSLALAMIAATAGGIVTWRKNQHLGEPGIRAAAIPGSVKMAIELPEDVPGFFSTNLPQSQIVLDTLPQDTSYAQRLYTATNQFWATASIVLMGADRTSIHKPEFCLPGQGWRVDVKTNFLVSVAGPQPYQFTAAKWILSKSIINAEGQSVEARGLYLFWFVADKEQTSSHWQRLWWLTRDLLTTGVLQRWAYVSYFSICLPGQEDATFDRMNRLINASVPEFQLPPGPAK